MVTLRQAASSLTQVAVCGIFRTGDVIADYLGSAISTIPGLGPIDPDANNLVRDMVCPENPPPPPPITIPGGGSPDGNCPVSYFVTYNYQANSNFLGPIDVQNQVTEQLGPIGGIRAEYGPENVGLGVFLETGNGEVQIVSRGGAWSGTPVAAITSIVRVDGLPDDCPPAIPPSGNPTYDTDITYNDNGVDVTVPVTVIFLPPLIGINGSLSIPLTINGPNFSLNPVFNFGDASVAFNLNLGNGDGNCCEPGTETPPELPPDDVGEDVEPERFFRALVVVVSGNTSTTSATELSAGQGVALFVPRLGTVSIRVRVGPETNAFLPDIAIKHRRQLVIIPENFVGNGYAAQPIPGLSFTLYPLYLRNYNDPMVP